MADLGGDLVEWRRQAACVGRPPEWWFPAPGGDTSAAEAVCARCRVAADCYAWAVETGRTSGIWGGVNFGSQ